MNKEELTTYIEVNSNGITLQGDTKFLKRENKVFINNHEITDIDTFFEVAEENTKLQQENKQLKENWNKLKEILNNEIKIIEEPKKIEKIKLDREECIEYYEDGIKKHLNTNKKDKMYVKILNEIIDYINSKEDNN